MRKFDYDRYIKRRDAISPRRVISRAISIRSAHPIDKKLDALDAASDSDDDDADEPPEVRHTLVAMVLEGSHQHVCVDLLCAARRYKSLLDTGSTLTLLNGIRFAGRFCGLSANT